MKSLTIKRGRATVILSYLAAALYGWFIVSALERLYLSDSGDINALVNFFDDIGGMENLAQYSLVGDGLFRYGILFLINITGFDILTILSFIAFSTSTTFMLLYFSKLKISSNIFLIIPIIIMVFFTPVVSTVFSSAIRSSIAFVILFFALNSLSGLYKYLLFTISSIIHLSMVPIIALFLLFGFYRKTGLISNPVLVWLGLFFYAASMVSVAFFLQFNTTLLNQGVFYNFLTICLAGLMILSCRFSIKKESLFIAIGLILVVLFGFAFNLSFSRYVGISLLFYLMYLTLQRGALVIVAFSTGYVFYFLPTLFYSISN